jgi:hypothetical protein
MKQGTLNVMLGGMPAAVDVYDDLFLSRGPKARRSGWPSAPWAR